MIVVDASVAVKWFLDESDSVAALNFLKTNGGALIAPELLSIEVGGAFIRRANMGYIGAEEAPGLFRDLTDMLASDVIRQISTSLEGLETAAHMAIQLRHPFKDCIYLALAIEQSCDLVTCDAKFVSKAKPLHAKVRHLTEIASGQGPSSPE